MGDPIPHLNRVEARASDVSREPDSNAGEEGSSDVRRRCWRERQQCSGDDEGQRRWQNGRKGVKSTTSGERWSVASPSTPPPPLHSITHHHSRLLSLKPWCAVTRCDPP